MCCKALHEDVIDVIAGQLRGGPGGGRASPFPHQRAGGRRVTFGATVRCYGRAFFGRTEVVNDIRIAPLGGHSSDHSADRDDRWGEHTLPYNWRSDLHGEPIAPGSVARRTRACWRLAHHGARGAALRGR